MCGGGRVERENTVTPCWKVDPAAPRELGANTRPRGKVNTPVSRVRGSKLWNQSQACEDGV